MTNSDDRAVTLLHALLQVARESLNGYTTAERNVPDAKIWRELEPYRKTRMKLVTDLEERVRVLRGDPDQPPSASAALHRRWIEFRTMVDEDPNGAVLAEVDRAERFATQVFADACKEHDVDPHTRKLIERGYEEVSTASSRVKQLLERAESATGSKL
jgi:uncharacterized protein (TIGR02284 family)